MSYYIENPISKILHLRLVNILDPGPVVRKSVPSKTELYTQDRLARCATIWDREIKRRDIWGS